MNMTPDQEKLLQTLNAGIAVLNTELPHIKETLDEIKRNLSFGEGQSPLRDSVSLLVGRQVAEQQKTCVDNVRSIVKNEVADAVKEHVTSMHARRNSDVSGLNKNQNQQMPQWVQNLITNRIIPWVVAIISAATIVAQNSGGIPTISGSQQKDNSAKFDVDDK